MDSRRLRRRFLVGMRDGLRVVWPILSILLGVMAALGTVIGLLEDWSLGDGLYFAFVSGLTIGYGDLVPNLPCSGDLHRLHGHSADRSCRRSGR